MKIQQHDSVNDLVAEEPKEDYENIIITWTNTYVILNPSKNEIIRAKFKVPVGYNQNIFLQMVHKSWKATQIQKQLKTTLEKGKFWRKHLQKYISINREFMS